MHLLLLGGAALAAPPPADPAVAKLSGPVRAAWLAVEAGVPPPRGEGLPGDGPDGLLVVAEGEDGDTLYAALSAAGFDVRAQSGGRVQLWAAHADLRRLGELPEVARVRLPWRASTKDRAGSGDVYTEGYDAIFATDWHEEGIYGTGVAVGIVDVGFVGAEELAGDEIPDDAKVDFSRGDSESTAHGTAVTEVIYDFAPRASYYLASFSTDVEFGEVLEAFADADVDVINGSIGFDNVWHADGSSSVSIYARRAVEDGAIYVAAAGNENDKYRVGVLGVEPDGAVTIAGRRGVSCNTSSGWAQVSFRWSEPFGEAAHDIDLVVYNSDGTECGRSEDAQDGTGWPYELVEAAGCSREVLAVPVVVDGSDVTGLEGYLYGYSGISSGDQTWTEDLTLPGDTDGAVTVGAWTPALDAVADYSSRGPTNDDRLKPDLVAPTGVSTATYGTAAFEGSSAAAPHVSGLAALWASASKRRDAPHRFLEWAQDNAVDGGDPGPDQTWGAGAAHADALPEGRCGCASAAPGGAGSAPAAWAPGWLGGILALIWRRRR